MQGVEETERLLPVAPAIELERLVVALEPPARHRVQRAGARHHLVAAQRLGAALHRDQVQQAIHERLRRRRHRGLADDDAHAVLLREALEPRGHVHRIADCGVDQPVLRAHVADDHLSGVDAHPEVQMRPAPRREDRLQHRERGHHVERRLAGAAGVIRLVHGRVPERFDRVARVLGQHPVVAEHHVRHLGAVAVEQRHQGGRRQGVGEGGEAPQVAEQHGHLARLAAQAQAVRIGEDPLAHRRRQVPSHRLADDPLLGLLDHQARGERGREAHEQRGGRVDQVQHQPALEHDRGHRAVEQQAPQHGEAGGQRAPGGHHQRGHQRHEHDERDRQRRRRRDQEPLVEHGLHRVAQDLDAPHAGVAGGRRRVLVDAADGGAQQHDAVVDQGGVEAALQHVHERDDAERRGGRARLRRRPQEVDQHGVVLGDRDRAPGRVHEPGAGRPVQHRGAAREVGHDGERQARHLLAARPQQQRETPHHAVLAGRDVGEPLVARAPPHRLRGPHEGVELLGHARSRIEPAGALGHHRHDDVVGAPHRVRQRAVLGPGRVEEDREGDHPGAGGAQGVERLRVERARPRGERAVLRQQRLVALLVDADDDGGARGLGGSRREQQVAGAGAGAREEAPERGGGQHERDAQGGQEARQEPLARGAARRHQPTSRIETSGGTRKRTGMMLVPTPGVTKRSRPPSRTWPIAKRAP